MEELQQQITELEALVAALRDQVAKHAKIIGIIAEKNPQIVRDAYQIMKLPENG